MTKYKSEKFEQVSITIEKEVLEKVRKLAKLEKRNLSNMVTILLDSAMLKKEGK